jgi:hypothetical protein
MERCCPRRSLLRENDLSAALGGPSCFPEIKAGPVSYSAQQCLDRATECDRMALDAKDCDAKAAFMECARQWLELARQKKDLQRDRH